MTSDGSHPPEQCYLRKSLASQDPVKGLPQMKMDIFESIQSIPEAAQGPLRVLGAMDGELEPRLQEEELRLLSFPVPVGYKSGGQDEVNLPLLGREEPSITPLYRAVS